MDGSDCLPSDIRQTWNHCRLKSFIFTPERMQSHITLQSDQPSMDTVGRMFVRRDAVPDIHAWTATLLDVQDGNTVSFKVSAPVTAPVDDQTYMEEKTLLQEYALNDVGKVWVGPVKTTRGKPWLFGQFDAVVLPACMFMLDRAELPFKHRGDPVKVTRAISRIVNSNDDGGVLVGRWDGMYDDGTAPSEWTGSVDILAQFLETQEPVSYGQCWVFAGVVTTVCRALGIPSRVVSNLVSAHDANSTLTVDKYFSETMEELGYDPSNAEPEQTDSIWNYHVWNDVWMSRPDLPAGYGGWQAIDATPQETSRGMYQCGPAPLEAIKQGAIGMNYDVEFMLASVNADLMNIGRMILTKKPYVFDPNGDEDREDIIDQYKFREGTASERLALMNGVRFSERAKRYYSVASSMQNDINFKLCDVDTVPIGQDFKVIVDIENTSSEGRNIKASLTANSVYYNGVRAGVIKKAEGHMFINGGKRDQIVLSVKSDDYLPKLVEYENMKISAMAIVMETKQSWAEEDDFQIIKPNINIKFNEDLIWNQPATAILSFTNPLDRGLTGCEFRLSSSGIEGRTLKLQASDAAPKEPISVEIPILPKKPGSINFVATFKSAELKDINGAATVEVYEA
ncbi:hypothetical protein SFRURICE_008735 [Spodoptera frugiperda]|nr:hypothetical protein SFRURICE_008735 [Spodoptera frugiperda]